MCQSSRDLVPYINPYCSVRVIDPLSLRHEPFLPLRLNFNVHQKSL